MIKTNSIRFHIVAKTAPWLAVFLVIASATILFLEKSIFNEQLNKVHDERVSHFIDNKNRVLASLLGQVSAIANNDLVVNGLIDIDNSENYLIALINSYSLAGTTENSIKIVDFNARTIVSNGVEISALATKELSNFRTIMDSAIGSYEYTNEGIAFIAPILWASSPEGAVIVEVSFSDLNQLLKADYLSGEIIHLNDENTVLFSTNMALSYDFVLVAGGYLANNTDRSQKFNDWYYKKYQLETGEVIFSFEGSDSIHNKLYWFVYLGFASIIIALFGSLISIFFSSSIISKLLNKYLLVLKNKKEGQPITTDLDVSSNDPEELVKIYQSFDAILVDLIRSENFGNDVQSIINSLCECLVVFDMNGKVSLSNLSFQKFSGSILSDDDIYKKIMPEDLQSKALSSKVLINDFECVYEVLVTNSDTGEHTIGERVIRWSRSLFMTNASTIGGLTFIGVDITEEKAIEKDIKDKNQAIQDLSQRFSLALESAEIGVWEYNVEDDCLIWDDRMHEMYQISKEDFSGSVNDWIERVHPQDFENTHEMLQASLTTGNDFFAVFRIILLNKEIRWISANARVINEHNSLRVVGANIDITETKRLNQDLGQALKKAEELVAIKSDFLASMSHEIRTPMNGVLGMLNLLKRTALSAQQARYTELAYTSADSLLSLINDILDFSKVDSGKLELEYIDFNLTDTLGGLAKSMAQRAQDKGLELVLDIAGVNNDMVNGDPGRLRQIFTNLIGNAIKFTDQGEVLIKVQLETDANNKLLLSAAIKDTGIGIPEHKIDSLFDSFSQVDASTTRKYGGTGLGLAIVKQLCELMQGEISIVSEFDKGSEFIFSLTLNQATEIPVDDPLTPTLEDIDLQGQSIMLVDDNTLNTDVLEKQLSVWAAKVASFNAVEDSLKYLAQDNLPSLILVDANMPDIDGLAFTTKLRQQPRFNATKIVLLTDIASHIDSQELQNLGLTTAITKPVTRNDFKTALFSSFEPVEMTNDEQIFDKELPEPTLRVTPKNISQSQPRILLVEDNIINQEVALGILNSWELTADIAKSGLAALSILNEKYYDLILMDCQMPEMDGYAATSAIRSGKTLQSTIPIIAMTANAMKGDREKCLTAGMDDYLSKPIDPKALLEKINEWSLVQANGNNDEEVIPVTTITQPLENAITWDRDDFMNRIMNNDMLAKKLVELFKVDTPNTLNELAIAVEKGQANEAGLLAHKLKGTVSNLGGIDLAGLAYKIEQAGREDDIVSIKDLWPQVKPKYDQLLDQIERGL